MRTCGFSLLLALAFLTLHRRVCDGGELKKMFYRESCPRAETIVRNITWSKVAANPALLAKLLRLPFHDCFVRFRRAMWEVLSGRRDGRVSSASEASSNLPSPAFGFNTLQQQFADNGLDISDLVVLSGAHTIGVAHCAAFSRRLFNFTGNNDAEPSLDLGYAGTLKAQCSSPCNSVGMDPDSSFSFDSHYYIALPQNRGLFTSDATLLTYKPVVNFARIYPKFNVFLAQFGNSMKKMGAIAVLTDDEGEIRKNCRIVK